MRGDVDVSNDRFFASGSETDPAIRVGLGVKMSASSKLEFEFTLLDDLDYLSVAYLF